MVSSMGAQLRLRREAGYSGEFVPAGIPARTPLLSILLHLLLLFCISSVWPWLESAGYLPHHDVRLRVRSTFVPVYYLRDSDVVLNDQGGAPSGRAGQAGGRVLYHEGQTIRVLRGELVQPRVENPPSIKLPATDREVANLLVISGYIPPIPAEEIPKPTTPRLLTLPEVIPPPVDLDGLKLARTPLLKVEAAAPPPPDPASAYLRKPDVIPSAVAVARQLTNHPRLELPPVSMSVPAPDLNWDRKLRAANSEQTVKAVLQPAASGSRTMPKPPVGARVEIESDAPSSADSSGVVISAIPASVLALPNTWTAGIVALAPKPGKDAGRGDSGEGSGLAGGDKAGAARDGNGAGVTAQGDASGQDRAAMKGTSLSRGLGGSGSATRPAAVPGVTVAGGVVNIPSFGSGPKPSSPPEPLPNGPRHPPAVVIVGSASSGGALGTYGALQGVKVYTLYINAAPSMVVLQFADPSQAVFEQDLTPPEPLKTTLPAGLRVTNVLIDCVLDQLGSLQKLTPLRAPNAEVANQLIAVLRNWRFRPALRGGNPIDVHAILGFGVNTR